MRMRAPHFEILRGAARRGVQQKSGQLPGQLVRDEVAVGRVERRILVHAADEPLAAALLQEPQLVEDLVEPLDYRPVEVVVVQLAGRWHCYWHLF